MQRALASAFIPAVFLFVSACFDAPARPVQFRCDLQTAPSCPDGYTCQSDGCCHRDDLDPAENWNACDLVDPPMTTTGPATGTFGTETATTGTSASTGASATTDEPVPDGSSTASTEAPSESSSGTEEGSSGEPAETDGAQ